MAGSALQPKSFAADGEAVPHIARCRADQEHDVADEHFLPTESEQIKIADRAQQRVPHGDWLASERIQMSAFQSLDTCVPNGADASESGDGSFARLRAMLSAVAMRSAMASALGAKCDAGCCRAQQRTRASSTDHPCGWTAQRRAGGR